MRQIIFGTDWCCDCDDVFAARILARAHKDGRIGLLGASVNATVRESAASLDGFFELEGLHDIPIGVGAPIPDFDGESKYQARLAKHAVRYKTNSDAEDGVRIYRRLIAQATEPVEILEVGFLTNLAGFLESGADDISPKSGIELMREKVTKLWAMAGKWDEVGGEEYNIHCTPTTRAAAFTVFEKCPVPITFLGYEVGRDVISGSRLAKSDVLKDVLNDFGYPDGRSSWDPMTAILAVIGDEAEAGYSTVRGTARVDVETGKNYFEECDTGAHCYVVKLHDDAYYRDMLDDAVASR